jgi:hypothetical protein
MVILKVICRVAVLIFTFSLVSFWSPLKGISQTAPSSDLFQEAKALYEKEEDYFQKRIKSDWPAIYNYQHPDFRKKVSLEAFKYLDGDASINALDELKVNVSGSDTSIQEIIHKSQEKKDILGYPTQRIYRLFSDPFFTMEGYAIDNIAINKDGKYAIAHYKANIDAQFAPGLWRGYKRYKFALSAEDFWEKVGDAWYITVLKKNTSICGVRIGYYLVPTNYADWKAMEFVEYDAGALRPEKSAEDKSTKGQP